MKPSSGNLAPASFISTEICMPTSTTLMSLCHFHNCKCCCNSPQWPVLLQDHFRATLLLSLVTNNMPTVAAFSSAHYLEGQSATIVYFFKWSQCLIFNLVICLWCCSRCLIPLLGSGVLGILHFCHSGPSRTRCLQTPLYCCPRAAAVSVIFPDFRVYILDHNSAAYTILWLAMTSSITSVSILLSSGGLCVQRVSCSIEKPQLFLLGSLQSKSRSTAQFFFQRAGVKFNLPTNNISLGGEKT